MKGLPHLVIRATAIATAFGLSLTSVATAAERRGIIANGGTIVWSCYYYPATRSATVRWRIEPRPDRPPQRASWTITLTPGLGRITYAYVNGSYSFPNIDQRPGLALIEGAATGTIVQGDVVFLYQYQIKVPFRTNCTPQ